MAREANCVEHAARRIESGGSFLASREERKVAAGAALCHSQTVSDQVSGAVGRKVHGRILWYTG
jgi:hypothetical protein